MGHDRRVDACPFRGAPVTDSLGVPRAAAKCGVSLPVFRCVHGDRVEAEVTARDCRECWLFGRDVVGSDLWRNDQATPSLSAEQMSRLIKHAPPGDWPGGWTGWENVQQAHLILLREILDRLSPYPAGVYSGRGIVVSVNAKPGMSSGKDLSHGYFPGAWAAVKELRRLGCQLPVLFAYLGDLEWDWSLTEMVKPLGVECLDLLRENEHDPMRILAGWESKVYAIIRAPFEEVLYLDADNLPLADPTFLFDTAVYREAGCVLWPDVGPHPSLGKKEWLPKEVWDAVGLPHDPDCRAAESGQLLINKRSWWRELCVTRWLNEHSDRYFAILFGDKDTFVLGGEIIGHRDCVPARYHMVPGTPNGDAGSLHQCWNGRPVFQHCTQNKPGLHGYPRFGLIVNRGHIADHLVELRYLWHGRLWHNESPNAAEAKLLSGMIGRDYIYSRTGLDSRPLRLLSDNTVSYRRGMARCEAGWSVFVRHGETRLVLSDVEGSPTAVFRQDGRGGWKGRWLQYEQCECSLVPEGEVHDMGRSDQTYRPISVHGDDKKQ